MRPMSGQENAVLSKESLYSKTTKRRRLPSPTIWTYNFPYVSMEGETVRTMSYSESRANYAETLNKVVDDREEVVITRAGRGPESGVRNH
jgi:hypothetical protein